MSFLQGYKLCLHTALFFAVYPGLAAAQDATSDQAFADMLESMATEMTNAPAAVVQIVNIPQIESSDCAEIPISNSAVEPLSDEALAQSLECLNGVNSIEIMPVVLASGS